MSRGSPGSLGSGGVAVHPGAGILLSVRNALTTLAACAVLALAGCGEDDATDTAAKTVTVTAAAPATTAPPPTASTQTSGASGATGTAGAGPPLPEGLVGIDGRYNLRTKGSEDDGPTISTRFTYYFEPSNATTTCSGGTCSVALRMGVKSGGSKRYTLGADPDRERTSASPIAPWRRASGSRCARRQSRTCSGAKWPSASTCSSRPPHGATARRPERSSPCAGHGSPDARSDPARSHVERVTTGAIARAGGAFASTESLSTVLVGDARMRW